MNVPAHQGILHLTLLRGDKVLRVWQVRGDIATIGAAEGNALRVRGDPAIAPHHATLYVEDGHVSVVAEPGAEVRLNGEPADFVVARPDDVVRIGRLVFRVRWEPPEPWEDDEEPLDLLEDEEPTDPRGGPPAIAPPMLPDTPDAWEDGTTDVGPDPLGPVDETDEAVAPVTPPPVPARGRTPHFPTPVPLEHAAWADEAWDEDSAADAPTVHARWAPHFSQPRPGPQPEPETRAASKPEPHADAVTEEAPEPAPRPTPWPDDDDDQERDWVEPFDLAQMLLERPQHPAEGRAERYCVGFATRVREGRVVETAHVTDDFAPWKAAGLEVRLDDATVRLESDAGWTGEIGRADGSTERYEGRATLAVGDHARLQAAVDQIRIDALAPPRAERPGFLALRPGFFVLVGLALVGHLGIGAAAAMVRPQAEQWLEPTQEEVFAVVEIPRPKPPKDVPKAQPRTAQQIAERAPAVTEQQVGNTPPPAPKNTVDNLLESLKRSTAGPGGTASDLEHAVSNVDAVPGTGGNTAFDLAGALDGLGDEVTYARESGAGGVQTKSGDSLDSALSKLAGGGSTGKVRGTVTKVTSQMKVEGRLSREAVSQVISSHMHEIQGCYEKQLVKDPGLAGRIVYEWTVTESGGVRGVRVDSSTLPSAEVADCISGLIKGWQFPTPEGGEVTISYPFLFRSMSR